MIDERAIKLQVFNYLNTDTNDLKLLTSILEGVDKDEYIV